MPTKIKWKSMYFLHYISSFEKYVLLTTSSFVSFCFTLAFTPLTFDGVALTWKPVRWFAQQTGWLVSVWGGTGAINGIIRECHSSQLSRTLFVAKKKKKKKKSLKQIQSDPLSHNGQGMLIKARVFCRCSLITVLYLFKNKDCHSFILRCVLVKNSLKCCKFWSF